jgi:predicted secreted protein
MSDILITQDDHGRSFTVNLGDLIVIHLKENLTTGYTWELMEIDPAILEFLESNYSPDPGRLMGTGGTRTFRFQAKSLGSQQIHLRYRRYWEEAKEHFIADIKVQ